MHLLCRGVGDPILFIHGIPTSHLLWSGIIERLRGRFTCFAVDLPGLGKTCKTPGGLGDLSAIAAEIDHVRASQGIEKWHVVGHDAGSAVAVHYAHSFDQHVDCLALLSPALFPELRPFYLFEILRKPFLGELLAPCVNPLFWRFAMQRACKGKEESLARAISSFREPFSGPRGSWHMMRVVRWGKPAEVLGPIPGFLPKLLAPTMIFHGMQDPAIPFAFAQRTYSLIRNSELVTLDSGHFIPLEQPKLVASNLLDFFERRAAKSPRATAVN